MAGGADFVELLAARVFDSPCAIAPAAAAGMEEDAEKNSGKTLPQ